MTGRPFTLWGVEDPALYLRSLEAYRAAVDRFVSAYFSQNLQ